MVKGPLPDRLEFAILQIVMSFNGKHQNSWGEWSSAVSRVSDLADGAELKAAFTRLWKHGNLRLTKWHVDAMCDIEYSGKEQDDSAFFFTGNFNAIITDEGRSYWGKLNLPQRDGVFISHITEEKPVAHVLQKYVKLAFGARVPVFVSSDGKSIGGGKKWYNHIIEHLRLSEIVLVLVSQESKGREWINFEAGFGEGMESLVIPVVSNEVIQQIPDLHVLDGHAVDPLVVLGTLLIRKIDGALPVAGPAGEAFAATNLAADVLPFGINPKQPISFGQTVGLQVKSSAPVIRHLPVFSDSYIFFSGHEASLTHKQQVQM